MGDTAGNRSDGLHPLGMLKLQFQLLLHGFIGDDSFSITGALETYARPLIGAGVRTYPRLDDIRIPKRT